MRSTATTVQNVYNLSLICKCTCVRVSGLGSQTLGFIQNSHGLKISCQSPWLGAARAVSARSANILPSRVQKERARERERERERCHAHKRTCTCRRMHARAHNHAHEFDKAALSQSSPCSLLSSSHQLSLSLPGCKPPPAAATLHGRTGKVRA
jgi:hypothetical protein